MKNVLNVLTDMCTLAALCVAAVGHILPWFDAQRVARFPSLTFASFEEWHVERSGIALAALGTFIALSLIVNWGPEMRRILNLLMFGSAFGALLFQLMIFSNAQFFADGGRLQLRDTSAGFGLSIIPTIVALSLCLLRMLWTMPPSRVPKAILVSPGPAARHAEKRVHPF